MLDVEEVVTAASQPGRSKWEKMGVVWGVFRNNAVNKYLIHLGEKVFLIRGFKKYSFR